MRSTLNLTEPAGAAKRRSRAPRRAIHAAYERWHQRVRGDHPPGPRPVRAARLARRPGRRHRPARALPHPPRRRRRRRARHPATTRVMERTLLGRHEGAPSRRRAGRPARRGARADVLQLGHPPGLQHRRRRRRDRVSRSPRPTPGPSRRPRPDRPPTVAARWTAGSCGAILERYDWSVPYAQLGRDADAGGRASSASGSRTRPGMAAVDDRDAPPGLLPEQGRLPGRPGPAGRAGAAAGAPAASTPSGASWWTRC